MRMNTFHKERPMLGKYSEENVSLESSGERSSVRHSLRNHYEGQGNYVSPDPVNVSFGPETPRSSTEVGGGYDLDSAVVGDTRDSFQLPETPVLPEGDSVQLESSETPQQGYLLDPSQFGLDDDANQLNYY